MINNVCGMCFKFTIMLSEFPSSVRFSGTPSASEVAARHQRGGIVGRAVRHHAGRPAGAPDDALQHRPGVRLHQGAVAC